MARCLLIQSGLPSSFWAEVISTANYIRNRCPTKSLNRRIPHEAWTGKTPNVHHMREFGCKVYCLDKVPNKGKFEERARKGIMLGVSDPPVPAGDGSGRAGSPRQLSNYRPVSVVGDQAQTPAKATGSKNDKDTEDPFKPRTKVTLRNPERFPARERSHSLSEIALKLNKEISIISLFECEEDSPKQAGKRKRVNETQDPDTSRKDSVDTEVEDLADKIKKINAMAKATMIPEDLKKAIADTTRALNRLQVANKNRNKGVKEVLVDKTNEEESRKTELKVCPKCGTGMEKIDAGTQTYSNKDINEDILVDQIRSCKDPNTFAELANLTWPEKAFQRTCVEKGKIEDIGKEWDLVIVSEEDFENLRNKKIIENPHEYEAIKKQEAKPGEMAYLNRTLLIPNKNGTMDRWERFLCQLEIGPPKEEKMKEDRATNQEVSEEMLVQFEETKDATQEEYINKTIKRLRIMTDTYNRRKIAIFIEDKTTLDKTRKTIEFIYKDANIMFKIFSKKEEEKPKKKNKWNYNKENEESIVISDSNKSYAETLKVLQEKIDVDKEKIKVTGVRSNKKGDLMISIRGDSADANRFRQIVSEKVEGCKANVNRRKGSKKVLHLKDLDKNTTTKDIERAIRDNVPKGNNEPIEIKALRPAYGERQNVTIITSEEMAKEMEKMGKIKIRWSECRIVVREEIIRCFKCWGFNHLAKDCDGKDLSKACRKCTKNGHSAEQCTEPARCALCDTEGHTTGSTRCAKYRTAYREAKKKRTKGDSGNKDGPTNNNKGQ
ncbi:Copia protein [Dufourea novaeangliae]|uniref:Copia protein n=1 Tax=Dufourea novaeangliae TaxID=178035 RepID=A0A154NXV7_DUFNO|nr:Copia protein [Dufourea novaeangliae]